MAFLVSERSNMHILTAAPQTMTSREIAELTGKSHGDVMRDIRNMLDGLQKDQSSFADIYLDGYNRQQPCFKLPYDETVCLLTGYDVKARMVVIQRWRELESTKVDPLVHLPAEQRALVQVMLDNADLKRQQAIHTQAIAQIESRVEAAVEANLLTSRPQNAESITHLRTRCAKAFGLPERIVEYVIRQSPYAPKPAGNVKNDDERALGGTYSVWWIKDVNDVLRRFVKECVMVTPAFAEHPYVDGRFKLARKEAA